MAIIFIRTAIMYLIVIISIRIMGRRQVGELQPSELVITMLISNLATMPMEDRALPFFSGLIPIIVLVCFEVFTSYLLKDSPILRKYICGSPQVIIKDGKIDQQVMKKLRFSVDDLIEELRINNIFDFSEVDCAIAETTGQLSVFKKYQFQEVENRNIGNMSDKTSCPSFIVVCDGKINHEGIKLCDRDERFIEKTLKQKGIDMKKVLVMICDKNGKYSIVEKE
ncbi:MAG: DUF421 domain-containing protein [Oscillospiraceae bacterium]|nr:DUF421 domain-containing protein [Oscillospiraceae bacterium]